MSTFEHDSAGFLIGKLIKASDRNEQHIKEQLELLRGIHDALVAPARQVRSARHPSNLTATAAAVRFGVASAPSGRAMATAPGQAALAMARVQARAMAQEARKDERRHSAATANRDSKGRFIGGRRDAAPKDAKDPQEKAREEAGQGFLMGLFKRMGKASIEASSGASNMDPTLMATKEVGAALAPLGRGLATLFSPMEKRSELRWQERMWNKVLRKLGKDKPEEKNGGGSGRGVGLGLFGGGGAGAGLMGRVLSKVPGILALVLRRIFLPVGLAMAAWDLGKTFYEWLSGTEIGMKMLDGVDNFVKWSKDTYKGIADSITSLPTRLGELFTSLDTAMRELPVIGKAYAAAVDAGKAVAEVAGTTITDIKKGFSEGVNPSQAAPAGESSIAKTAGRLLGQGAAIAGQGAALVGNGAAAATGAVKTAVSKASTKARALWDGGVKDDLVTAAAAANVPASTVTKIAHFESGFNANAAPISRNAAMNTVRQHDGRMAISTANGYGQFLDGTWQGSLNKWGSKYGVAGAGTLTKDQANALRGDKRLQAAMLAEFTAENIQKGRRLGGSSDDANVYAFHNLGEGDATRMLSALRDNPSSSMYDALVGGRDITRKEESRIRSVISGNPSLYGNGQISVKEAYDNMDALMQRGAPFAAEAAAAQAAISAPTASIPASASTSTISTPAVKSVPPAAAGVNIPKMEETRVPVPLGGSDSPSLRVRLQSDTSQNVPDRQIAQIVTGGMN